MKKILICTRKGKGDDERAEEESAEASYNAIGAKGQYKGQIKVVRDEQLPWTDLRAIHGSYPAAYKSIAEKYDVVFLVEAFDGQNRTIARGQFSIAEAALAAGKSVRVRRDRRFERVQSVEVFDPNDWKTQYGRVVI